MINSEFLIFRVPSPAAFVSRIVLLAIAIFVIVFGIVAQSEGASGRDVSQFLDGKDQEELFEIATGHSDTNTAIEATKLLLDPRARAYVVLETESDEIRNKALPLINNTAMYEWVFYKSSHDAIKKAIENTLGYTPNIEKFLAPVTIPEPDPNLGKPVSGGTWIALGVMGFFGMLLFLGIGKYVTDRDAATYNEEVLPSAFLLALTFAVSGVLHQLGVLDAPDEENMWTFGILIGPPLLGFILGIMKI